MRIFLSSVCMLAAALLIGASPPARAADAVLTGEMAPFNGLLGGPWSCSTVMGAMDGQPAQTQAATLTFDVVGGNVLHDRVSAADYSDDDYFGYSPKMKMYWSVSADSLGNHGSAASTDGKTYTGTTYMGHATMSITSTYTMAGPGKSTVHEVISMGGQQQTIDSTCTR